jgi:hypothetical protein
VWSKRENGLHAGDAATGDRSPGGGPGPGKHTLTVALPVVQRRAESAGGESHGDAVATRSAASRVRPRRCRTAIGSRRCSDAMTFRGSRRTSAARRLRPASSSARRRTRPARLWRSAKRPISTPRHTRRRTWSSSARACSCAVGSVKPAMPTSAARTRSPTRWSQAAPPATCSIWTFARQRRGSRRRRPGRRDPRTRRPAARRGGRAPCTRSTTSGGGASDRGGRALRQAARPTPSLPGWATRPPATSHLRAENAAMADPRPEGRSAMGSHGAVRQIECSDG